MLPNGQSGSNILLRMWPKNCLVSMTALANKGRLLFI